MVVMSPDSMVFCLCCPQKTGLTLTHEKTSQCRAEASPTFCLPDQKPRHLTRKRRAIKDVGCSTKQMNNSSISGINKIHALTFGTCFMEVLENSTPIVCLQWIWFLQK